MEYAGDRGAVALDAVAAWRVAERTAELLSGQHAIRGVVLYGSVARGRSDGGSDIDMLVVGVDPTVTSRILLSGLPEDMKRRRLSLQYMTESELARLFDAGPAFTEHLRREGVILYDENGSLRETMAAPARHPISIDDEISMHLRQLRPLGDWPQYNGNHLACLARLYAIAKAVVILVLLKYDIAEFDHRTIFSIYRERYPDRAGDVAIVAELAAFARLVAGQPAVLPFSYRNAEPRARAALAAIQRLAAP
jgi:predicted nucleotidyltransferase